MFKPILLSCAALLVAGTQLSTQYSPEKGFKVEIESELSLKTTSSSFERDGEPVEGRGGGDMASSQKHHAVFVDKIVAAAGGKATQLTRSFETLSGASTMSFGGEENTREAEPQLQGVTLSLERNESGEVEAKVLEGTAPSAKECLEGHRMELALDALLPDGEVADGASWELGKDAVRRALSLDMEKALFPRPAPSEGDAPRGGRGGGGGGFRGGPGGGDSRVLDLAEWEGKATLTEEKVERDGVACRVISIELKAQGDLPEPERPEGGGRRGQLLGLPEAAFFGTTYKIELEGKLFFSTEDKRPVALEIEGSLGLETDTERTMRESVMRIRSTREGTFKQTVSISRP